MEEEEVQKIVVIPQSDAAVDPRAVVIELGDAALAQRTVLRPSGLHEAARFALRVAPRKDGAKRKHRKINRVVRRSDFSGIGPTAQEPRPFVIQSTIAIQSIVEAQKQRDATNRDSRPSPRWKRECVARSASNSPGCCARRWPPGLAQTSPNTATPRT